MRTYSVDTLRRVYRYLNYKIIIMNIYRNSVDTLRREYRSLDYKMQKVKGKAEQARHQRESIELTEDKVS